MTKDRGIRALRLAALLAVAGFIALPSNRAGAYLFSVQGSSIIQWKAGSAGMWNDATKTLSWSLSTFQFPQPNWPTPAQAGAAFQNSYQTHMDTIGTSIKFNRLPNSATKPTSGDGLLQMCFCPNENLDYFGFNIAGAFAVTFTIWDTTNGATQGALLDADIEMNGDPNTFTWSTSGPPPLSGTNDVEVTSVHEQSHSIGGNHTVYYYAAVWWIGRYPELMMFDRCLGPDDRVLIRTLYPSGTALGTITGTVTASAGGACNLAVIVATDANGIPQATHTTNASGFYTINVPAGTYTVTAHHNSNINYNSDIDFTGATGFINSATTAAFAVTAGATTAGHDFTVTSGTPTMMLSRLALSTVANLTSLNATQTLFFNKGGPATTVKLECTGTTGAGNITGVNMGPVADISCITGATSASNNPNHVVVLVTVTVAAGATPGCRNVSFVRNGERCFAPSFVEVLDTGALTVATGAQNPPSGAAAFNSVDRPLLQMTLTANAVEDIRIRKLQFALAGSGGPLPAVRLWKDVGTTPGTVDGTDVRIFSGNAYATSPISETIQGVAPGTVVFDNLCLTIPAGTTVPLLLTADTPASGSGAFTASFDPTVAANITAHGMFWGDVYVSGGASPNGLLSGTAVTGGTQNLGALAVGTLSQIHTTAPQNVIPVGGSTDEAQITLQGVVSASAGTVGIEVERKPLGTAFDGAGTFTTATTFASGTLCTVNATGLISGTSYHWRARGLSSAGGPSGWVSFGGNAETAADFTCDTSTTPVPSALQQFDPNGGAIVPVSGSVRGYILLQATSSTNSQGLPVRIEVEVQPTGTAFTGTPNAFSGFSATPAALQASFQSSTADYHWQARCATATGSASAYVNFNAAAIHFHLDAFQEISASAGCIGRAGGVPGDGMLLFLAAGAALFAVTFRRGAAKKAATALFVLVCIGGTAMAAEDEPLPRSLADAYPARETSWPETPDAVVSAPEPAMAPDKSFMTVDAYLGWLLMDMNFKALGTDFVNRKVSGMGTVALGVEGLVDIVEDWRAGLAAEVDYWGDVRIIGVGAVGSWRFIGSHRNNVTRYSDTEHYVRLGVFYDKLTVTKQNFGSFDATIAVRLGYELRLALGDGWFVLIGANFQYSQWNYSPSILSGDDKIGGFGGLITIGAAYLP